MAEFIEKQKRNIENDVMMIDDDDDEDTQANKYLSFRIAKESFGISIRFIREIIEMQNIIEVPDMPNYVKGVINLRGKVIPIIDLRLRFGIEERAYDDRNCVIVTELNSNTIGLIVDTVEEVVEILDKNIEPSPNFRGSSAKERYISGLGKVGEQVKILLDAHKILFEKDEQLVSDLVEKNK
jgi:purine-binding chemotaxis protein CheW